MKPVNENHGWIIHGLPVAQNKGGMKARLNNLITRYEDERDKIKIKPTVNLRPCELDRLRVIDEVLKSLYSLRR